MIIWGSKGREIELSSGQFYCPKCDTTRPYKHKRLAKYFTIYFIPLFQIENLGEYIECQVCHQTFKPEVLDYKPPSPAERLLVALRAELESGTPMQIAQRKLINMGMDEDAAKKLVNIAAGERQKTCQNCGFTYRETIALCSNCGNRLTTVGL